jgi:hypothetical protein
MGIRAVVINPYDQKIERVYDDFHLDDRLVFYYLQADTFSKLRLDDRNILYLDACGPMRRDQKFWAFSGYQAVLAGKGLIIGEAANEDRISATAVVEVLNDVIEWVPRDEALMRLPYEGGLPFQRYDTIDRMIISREGHVISVAG